MKTNNKTIINYLLITLSSVILFTLVAYLTAFSFDHKIIIGSVLYFAVTYLSSKYLHIVRPAILLQVIIILPVVLVIIFFNIVQYKSTAVSAPSNIFLLISAFTGYLFYKYQNYLWPFLLMMCLFTWQYKGKRMFLNYINFGTLSGKVNERIPLAYLYNNNGTVATSSLSKTVILDFWNSKCGYCYALFPFVDSIHKKIDTSRFDLMVVNIPFKNEKKEDNYKLLDRFNYSFKQVFMDDVSSTDSFKITGFPTTIVVQQNKIIYRGDFKEALKFLDIK